jgi:hypothetical protein
MSLGKEMCNVLCGLCLSNAVHQKWALQFDPSALLKLFRCTPPPLGTGRIELVLVDGVKRPAQELVSRRDTGSHSGAAFTSHRASWKMRNLPMARKNIYSVWTQLAPSSLSL